MGKEMTAKIQLCPPPKPFTRTKEFEVVSRNLDTTLTIKVRYGTDQLDIKGTSVADPNFFHPGSASKNLSILNQKHGF
jgi:hypothetical protein